MLKLIDDPRGRVWLSGGNGGRGGMWPREWIDRLSAADASADDLHALSHRAVAAMNTIETVTKANEAARSGGEFSEDGLRQRMVDTVKQTLPPAFRELEGEITAAQSKLDSLLQSAERSEIDPANVSQAFIRDGIRRSVEAMKPGEREGFIATANDMLVIEAMLEPPQFVTKITEAQRNELIARRAEARTPGIMTRISDLKTGISSARQLHTDMVIATADLLREPTQSVAKSFGVAA